MESLAVIGERKKKDSKVQKVEKRDFNAHEKGDHGKSATGHKHDL